MKQWNLNLRSIPVKTKINKVDEGVKHTPEATFIWRPYLYNTLDKFKDALKRCANKPKVYEVVKTINKDIYSFDDIDSVIRETGFEDIESNNNGVTKVLIVHSKDGDYLIGAVSYNRADQLSFIPNPEYLSIVEIKNNLDKFIEDKKAILHYLSGQVDTLDSEDKRDKENAQELLRIAEGILEDILTHQNIDSIENRYRELVKMDLETDIIQFTN